MQQAVTITIPRATPAEIQRGVQAAMAEFERAGIQPLAAAIGLSKREAWDLSGFNDEFEITKSELAAAKVWDRADHAARDAACSAWPDDRTKPSHADLALVTDPETQLADRDTALSMIRARINAVDGTPGQLDTRVFVLAARLAGNVEDRLRARDLVDAVAMAYTDLRCAGRVSGMSIEIARKRALGAVDELERAGTLTTH
ncbi:hypothetical protein [Mesorhizobium sp. L-8-3]|uniref:hypothetical protein n=1 Tax=Mesorhizobium sp. L-8-3 TaxID=2744522 RepID=UPI001925D478|nr:hypothetical protein [Mesorhizobium sp. L-8-3]BCH23525.1 hypothetical protein MesoLjLb_33100 [Mesorhizobium sp. L-8-3]